MGLASLLDKNLVKQASGLEGAPCCSNSTLLNEGLADALGKYGMLFVLRGDFSQAQIAYVESLTLYQQIDAKRDVPDVQHHLAYVYLHHGDTEYAGQHILWLARHIAGDSAARLIKTVRSHPWQNNSW